MNHFVG